MRPEIALFAGADGLAVIRRLIAEAPKYLTPKGKLVLEIGDTQADAIRSLIDAEPAYCTYQLIKDYAEKRTDCVCQYFLKLVGEFANPIRKIIISPFCVSISAILLKFIEKPPEILQKCFLLTYFAKICYTKSKKRWWRISFSWRAIFSVFFETQPILLTLTMCSLLNIFLREGADYKWRAKHQTIYLLSKTPISRTQAKAGNDAAFRQLFDKHYKWVYNKAYRMLGNYQDTEEVASDVFVKVWQKLNKNKWNAEKGSFQAWLNMVARNTIIDAIRKRNRIREHPLTGSPDEDEQPLSKYEDPDADPEQELEAAEAQQILESALEQVTKPNHRIAWMCTAFRGLQYCRDCPHS